MSWPSRGTRKIVVDGQEFLFAPKDRVLSLLPATVGAEGSRYYLGIWPGAGAGWGEMRLVVAAIHWALRNGWSPITGPDRHVMLRADETFGWAGPEDGVPWSPPSAGLTQALIMLPPEENPAGSPP